MSFATFFGNTRWDTKQSFFWSFRALPQGGTNTAFANLGTSRKRLCQSFEARDGAPYLGQIFVLAKVCGSEDLSKEPSLHRKKETVLESIATDVYTGQRKAKTAPRHVLDAIAVNAGCLALFADRFLPRHVVFLISIVAHYADGQHISPS